MKKKVYESYEEAILHQVSDFNAVSETEFLSDGKVCVIGEDVSDNNLQEQDQLINSMPFLSWLMNE